MSNAWEYNRKGVELHHQNRFEEAIEYYSKAINLDGKYLEALNNKGNALWRLNRNEEALEYFNKVLSIDNSYSNAWNDKGQSLEALKKYEEAVQCYEKALQCDPNNATAEIRVKNARELVKGQKKINSQASSSFKYDVFISYSWKQKHKVDNLFKILTNNGLKCWMDRNEINSGDLLYEELVDAIVSSKVVILCLSNNYLQSENCFREAHFSITHKKKYIPILVEDKRSFPSWPPADKLMFLIGDSVYNAELVNLLDEAPSTLPKPLNDFIQQIRSKMN